MTAKCSRAGCSQVATKLIEWANPKIHLGGRTKTWAACHDHLGYLVDYLSARNFYLGTKDFEAKHD